MVAKIGRSSNLFGAISYNTSKIEKEKGVILMLNKMIETSDGKYSVSQLAKSFESYLFANRNTEKHTLHISLNPDPKDNVSDEKYREIAQDYMNEMGFGNQPFIVFKHMDIDRSHIHIVSVCVDEDGKKISDQFEKVRSMKVCRELEMKFGLISAIKKERVKNNQVFQSVNYKKGDVKSQIASVIRNLSTYYRFQSFGEYNALLSLYNITAEKVEGQIHGKQQKGLLYFPLDHEGEKVGSPFKASLFGKKAGIDEIEKHFEICKKEMINHLGKEIIKSTINKALHSSVDENEFKTELSAVGIETVSRKNIQGRIYGITFIDHNSKNVWNGSRLGKEFSANVFNEKWNKSNKADREDGDFQKMFSKNEDVKDSKFSEVSHPLFDILSSNMTEIIESFGGLLPEAHVEDSEEIDFANKMRKKTQKKRKYKN